MTIPDTTYYNLTSFIPFPVKPLQFILNEIDAKDTSALEQGIILVICPSSVVGRHRLWLIRDVVPKGTIQVRIWITGYWYCIVVILVGSLIVIFVVVICNECFWPWWRWW